MAGVLVQRKIIMDASPGQEKTTRRRTSVIQTGEAVASTLTTRKLKVVVGAHT